jgi:hypothetical protein
MQWVRRQVAERGLANRSTLEVGSLNVNGSVRPLFTGPYVGIDMQAGSGVDMVLNAHDLGMVSNRFDCIVCTEMLEHDDQPWLSLQQMAKVGTQSCVLLLTARGFDHRGCFPLHEYPHDLWRFTQGSMSALLEYAGWKVDQIQSDPEAPGVFAVAYLLA